MDEFTIGGRIVDVVAGRVYPGILEVKDGVVVSVTEDPGAMGPLIMPGLIDSHVHVESSMLIPSEFARLAVVHGTTAVVADPHEIANVLGLEGVRFMIQNGSTVPFNFYFGAPSCVPATSFETAGAILGPDEVEEMLSWPDIHFLSEMMNFPGVLSKDDAVMQKITAARLLGKPIDGHAPGLKGDEAKRYADAGISTDHECFTVEEAIDKIKAGMKILIREGSAAKNFDDLIELIGDYPEMIMFCSDDKHPDDLVTGHVNLLVKKAINAGYNFMDVIRACTLNPVLHYRLEPALLQPGEKADFIIVDNAEDFNVEATYISGKLVASEGLSMIEREFTEPLNNFNPMQPTLEDLKVHAESGTLNVIKAYDGQLVTTREQVAPTIVNNEIVSDLSRDLLKLVVLNRYNQAKPAIGFINGFGLREGALASSVSHDSHNIIAVGTDDQSLLRAINLVIQSKGGIAVTSSSGDHMLPLPMAGLMSTDDGYLVAEHYQQVNKQAHELGSTLDSPFMTLSFMALLVIPDLKLSDKGMFDGSTFSLIKLLHL